MPGSQKFGNGCRKRISWPGGISMKVAGLLSFDAIWLTSLLEPMPSLTEIFSDWPIAFRMVSAMSPGAFRVLVRSK